MSTNLFTSSTLTKKQTKELQVATNKETARALNDFFKSIEAEFAKVIKDKEINVRNLANATKGKYQTAINVVSACFPYQDKTPIVKITYDDNGKQIVNVEAGALMCKKAVKNEAGEITGYIWDYKKLTASGARGIVRESLKNYTNSVGHPVVNVVNAGAVVE